MPNATGTQQSMLYSMRGATSDNRDRSAEQKYSNSGNPMLPMFNTSAQAQYGNFYGGQAPNLGRYVPPTLSNAGSSNSPLWNTNPGGYAYNLPNAYGGYQGVAQFGNQSWLQNYLAGGGPQMPQFNFGTNPQAKPAMQQPPMQQPPMPGMGGAQDVAFAEQAAMQGGSGGMFDQMGGQFTGGPISRPGTDVNAGRLPPQSITPAPLPRPGGRPQLSTANPGPHIPIINPVRY